MTHACAAPASRAFRGFSLVEMLLAIFILGIGVISIAALFPAGIALQRQANDDTVGPIVAKNALATIRSKLSQSDFGSFQDYGVDVGYLGPGIAGTFRSNGASGQVFRPPAGDWCWMRPGFLFGGVNAGTIDVFSSNATRRALQLPNAAGPQASEISVDGYPANAPVLWGIPYNISKYPLFSNAALAGQLDQVSQRLLEPLVTFTQAERTFPQGGSTSGVSAQGAYYWDCMFRRYAGRVQVAVFVYRVTSPNAQPYSVQQISAQVAGTSGQPANSFDGNPSSPPIPLVYFAPPPGAGAWSATAVPPDVIPGTDSSPTSIFGAGKTWDDWMAPGQVWVDNHGNLHGVLRGKLIAGSTGGTGSQVQGPVKLQRRIPAVPPAPVNGVWPNGVGNGFNLGIGAIWFVPNSDKAGNIITPVYATVEEL